VSTDEGLHAGHRSTRRKHRNYAAPGIFFVTICANANRCIFGRVTEKRTELSVLGEITRKAWTAIPSHFARINLLAFVILPNHLHGIIEIAYAVGAQHAAPQLSANVNSRVCADVTRGSLGAMIRSFKAEVTKQAQEKLNWKGEIW